MKKKYKKTKIPQIVRRKVWINFLGRNFDAMCMCCNIEPISINNFNCGHIISEKDGGSTKIDNLRPICTQCNSSMGIMNMEEFMEKYGFEKYNNWDGFKENNGMNFKKSKIKKIKQKSKNNSNGLKPRTLKKRFLRHYGIG